MERRARFFEGRSSGSMIIHCGDGWHYNLREQRRSRLRLQCRHYGAGCTATARVDLATGLLHHLQPHNLLPDRLLEQDFDLRRIILRTVRRDVFGTKLRTILNNIKLQYDLRLASRFTKVRMHSAMYAARSQNYPPIPRTLIHLGVLLGMPNLRRLCETMDRRDFIYQGFVGCVQDKTSALIFASGRMLRFLGRVENIHADGTFKKRSRKPKMAQIFNLCTNLNGFVVPVVRVLMVSRTEEAYVAVLSYLKVLAPTWAPARIHCDFERAEMNAFRRVLPMARVVGCLWHYGVASSSKACKLGLSPLAKDHEDVKTFIRCIGSVPLLPQNRIWSGVLGIWREVEDSGWAAELRPFFEYFEREWKPRVAELSVNGVPERTNNVSESDNRSLASVIPQNRPNIWHLVGAFVQLEHLSSADKIAIEEGRAPTHSRRWKAIWNDRRVQRLSRLLADGQMTAARFLHQVSYVNLAAVNHGLHLHNDLSDSETDSD